MYSRAGRGSVAASVRFILCRAANTRTLWGSLGNRSPISVWLSPPLSFSLTLSSSASAFPTRRLLLVELLSPDQWSWLHIRVYVHVLVFSPALALVGSTASNYIFPDDRMGDRSFESAIYYPCFSLPLRISTASLYSSSHIIFILPFHILSNYRGFFALSYLETVYGVARRTERDLKFTVWVRYHAVALRIIASTLCLSPPLPACLSLYLSLSASLCLPPLSLSLSLFWFLSRPLPSIHTRIHIHFGEDFWEVSVYNSR